ncbi:hypothetical protein BT93_B2979 [Corymbia citriodora subsp. variegata]|nr:hypothetical protein BT93_B2979 [Corymbia citriodora subsp. variegata]
MRSTNFEEPPGNVGRVQAASSVSPPSPPFSFPRSLPLSWRIALRSRVRDEDRRNDRRVRRLKVRSCSSNAVLVYRIRESQNLTFFESCAPEDLRSRLKYRTELLDTLILSFPYKLFCLPFGSQGSHFQIVYNYHRIYTSIY